MADHNLQIKITADVNSLQAKMALAKTDLTELNAKVKSLAGQFRTASAEMKASLAPQLDASAQEAAKMRAEIAALTAEMREQAGAPASMFGALGEKIEGATAKVEGITDKLQVFQRAAGAVSEFVMAGLAVEQVGEAFKSVGELGEQLEQLSQRTGMSTEALSGLRMVAIETGTDFNTVGEGMQHLAQSMQMAVATPSSTAAAAFRALGVSVTDSAGHLRPMGDVLDEVAQKLDQYADGTAKAALAGDIFGQRMGGEMIPVLHEVTGDGGLPGVTEKAREMGMAITEAAARTDSDFLKALREAGIGLDALKVQFVQPLLPILTELSEGFTQNSTQSVVLKTAIASLDVALTGVIGTGEAVATAVNAVGDIFFNLGVTIGDVTKLEFALNEALDGNFTEAVATAKGAIADLRASYADLGKTLDGDLQKETEIFTGQMGAGAAGDGQGDGGGNKPQAPTIAPSGGSKDWMTAQNDALAAQEQKLELSATNWKAVDDEKLQTEVTFWRKVTEQAGLSADQQQAAQGKLLQAEANLHMHRLEAAQSGTSAVRTATNDQVQIAQDAADAQKQIVQANYQAQVAQWDAEVSAGKMTKAQELQNEITAQQQMFTADYTAAKAQAQLASLSVTAKAKALDDLEVMQAQHNAEMVKMNADLSKELQDEMKAAADASAQAWQRAFQPIQQAFDTSINGVLQGTETLKQAELKAAQSIALAFIDAEAKKLEAALVSDARQLTMHLATEFGMTAATTAGVTARVAAQAAGDEQGKALSLATSLTQMGHYAATAAGGAFSAVAGIPIVGPVLAPVAAATAFTAVMGYEVMSAAGGTVIEAGVNPLVQLHEKEMVLPAHIAQPLQSALASNSFSGPTGGDVNNYHITQTLNAHNAAAGDFTDQVWKSLEAGAREGRHTSGRYPAMNRIMRRGG